MCVVGVNLQPGMHACRIICVVGCAVCVLTSLTRCAPQRGGPHAPSQAGVPPTFNPTRIAPPDHIHRTLCRGWRPCLCLRCSLALCPP